MPKQQTRGEVQVVHRRNKGPTKIGRDLEPKVQTKDGNELEEDPTREEMIGEQWVDVQTGLAVVDVTTIRVIQTSAEEEVGGPETILPIEATAALVYAHTPQNRAKDQAIQSVHGVEQVGGEMEVPPAGVAASIPGSADGGKVHNGEPAHD